MEREKRQHEIRRIRRNNMILANRVEADMARQRQLLIGGKKEVKFSGKKQG